MFGCRHFLWAAYGCILATSLFLSLLNCTRLFLFSTLSFAVFTGSDVSSAFPAASFWAIGILLMFIMRLIFYPVGPRGFENFNEETCVVMSGWSFFSLWLYMVISGSQTSICVAEAAWRVWGHILPIPSLFPSLKNVFVFLALSHYFEYILLISLDPILSRVPMWMQYSRSSERFDTSTTSNTRNYVTKEPKRSLLCIYSQGSEHGRGLNCSAYRCITIFDVTNVLSIHKKKERK